MKTRIDAITMTDKEKNKLRIYRVEGSRDDTPEFCITDNGEHFVFTLLDVDSIADAIRSVAATK